MLKLKILKISEALYNDQAKQVTVPGIAGEMTILPDHEPMVSSLKPGTITVKDSEGTDQVFEIDHGFVEVSAEGVTILL